MAHNGRFTKGWRMRGGVLAAVGIALAGSFPASAVEDGPTLGAARSFAVLGGSTVSSTGMTEVTGDVGVSPGTEITGFPPGTITNGALHAGDATAAAAAADAAIAYGFAEGMASIPANNLTDLDLGGMTLAPGVYKFNSSAQLTGDLVLDAQGHSDALFVFQVASTLTTSSGSNVTVIHGGANYDESRIFWQVGASATLGSGTAFKGNILAYASITLVTGSSLTGNALALNGAVTLDFNVVKSPRGGSGGTIGRPSKGRSEMAPPVGGLDTDAFARIDGKYFPARAARLERSWLRVKVRHLDASTDYTLWADDPSTVGTELVQFDVFTTKNSGNFNYAKDTKKGDALPFGATLATLAGKAVEVRDSAGTTTLLTGIIPTMTP
jgi:ice-binding like protein